MKGYRAHGLILISALLFTFIPLHAYAADDLVLVQSSIRFSTNTFLEGKTVRIYANIANPGSGDLRGVVRFFDGVNQIQSDQPVSVLAGRDDSVFVDWTPNVPGDHSIKISVVVFERTDSNPENNSYVRTVSVLADTDRDGKPNTSDPDDDNDGVNDEEDAFPLNRNETKDTDGDGIGDNKDTDDDGDGVPDVIDAFPLDPSETKDTDGDGIGDNKDTDDDGDGLLDEDEIQAGTNPLNADTDGDLVRDNEDAYPLDPSRAFDYDKDGIMDSEDPDADGDGIPKTEDINDTNLGPLIVITSNDGPPRRFIYPGENVQFEATKSSDPDGEIASILWTINGQNTAGNKLNLTFDNLGSHNVEVSIKDDKGETRSASFKIFVIPTYLPWILIIIFFIIIILAIFLVFSYSKPRRSRFEKVIDILDTINKAIPKAKKRKVSKK